jgi:type I restriction enzyme R subunit
MTAKPERVTQNRVVDLFRHQLGYTYLGDWQDRSNNSNLEADLLQQYLQTRGYQPAQISKALFTLRESASRQGQTLYDNNKAFYQFLYYGVDVKTEAGAKTETLQLIDWANPTANSFYIAEEVTVFGKKQKRPDIVLYVNGIALVVLELKNSRASVGEGIRQSLNNQSPEFISSFFNTIQFVLAGNDSEGLRYGTIGTPEKFFLTWKEDEEDNVGYKLDKYLTKLCRPERLLELIHDFVVFDAGVKKLPRPHQYFGVKAAQKYIENREGGIIWHTQGSGKSITMVLLAQWILRSNPHGRIVIITDRDELDKQIEGVFRNSGEAIHRTSSGQDLLTQLGQAKPRLLCSLIHKFGQRGVDNLESFIKELQQQPPTAVGDIHVFVDECHRTQSGKLHRLMKALLPQALFVGFTGTPLLKKDKVTSLEVFGRYIHTYKFNEAVTDGVVLDLVYEARDIDTRLSSPAKVDEWFEAKTRGLTKYQQGTLKQRWGTMQNVLSSRSRMEKIVEDICFDFAVKPRLSSQAGNAILVAGSIYEACRYYELFQRTELAGKCGLVTSYNPQTKDIVTEETGANTETQKQYIYRTYGQLLESVVAQGRKSKTETYEDWVKAQFITAPAQMKLLVVVSKLLTGFDAPPCTYLYIDKAMQDHGLFQAICRVNRLDSDDKSVGYIVDYKDLFKRVENAVAVYTAELDYDSFEPQDCDVLLKDRLKLGKEKLDDALETLEFLCEPVDPPKDDLAYIRYFCGNTEIPSDLQEREPQRYSLYKAVVTFVRAYANLASDLEAAGYSSRQIMHLKDRLKHYENLREVIRQASDEKLDLKAYEADMRLLLDRYIEADSPRQISPFEDLPLLDVIVNSGIAEAIQAKLNNLRGNQPAIAETIENNVRRRIAKEQLLDPAYFGQMSTLLDEIIRQRKQNALTYEAYLQELATLVRKVATGQSDDTPKAIDTPAKRALYNNLGQDEILTLKVHQAVMSSKSDGFRGNQAKENLIKQALYQVLNDVDRVEQIFNIVKQQDEY